VLHPELAVFIIFLYEFLPLGNNPKKKKNSATHSKEFCQKQMHQIRQILKQNKYEIVVFRQ
jgi:hypothetical protein